MNTTENIVEPLFAKIEALGKTSCELIKLKAVNKTAAIAAQAMASAMLIHVLVIAMLLLDVAFALWLGDWLGKAYEGFFVMAGANAMAALLMYWLHPITKRCINSWIIKQALK